MFKDHAYVSQDHGGNSSSSGDDVGLAVSPNGSHGDGGKNDEKRWSAEPLEMSGAQNNRKRSREWLARYIPTSPVNALSYESLKITTTLFVSQFKLSLIDVACFYYLDIIFFCLDK